jgi:hypothetical protein
MAHDLLQHLRQVARLGIPAGTPVAEHIRTGYTADNKPVRLMLSIIWVTR